MWKNTFWHGLVWGLLLPALGILLTYNIDAWLIKKNAFGTELRPWTGFKPSTLGLISLCANLIPAIFANRRRMDDFIRGLMFPTVIGAFVWLFYYDPLQLFAKG